MACLIKKKIYGRIYYYCGNPKRVNGKPKVVNLRYLGTAESIIKRLSEPPVIDPQAVDSLKYGAVASLLGQAKELGLVEIIDEMIPQKQDRKISVGTFLTVGAINRAINPKSKDSIGKWMNKTILPRLIGQKASAFDSQSFWDAMHLISDEDIAKIEERVWARVLRLYQIFTDVLFYDTTNFPTHIDSLTPCRLPQPGRPKSGGREQRLVGLALAATQLLGLPFLHKIYEGNCHDAKLFPGAMSLLIERFARLSKATKDLTVVYDKGNNSEENIQGIKALGRKWGINVFYVGSLKAAHYPDFLNVSLERFSETVGDYKVYRTLAKIFGQKRVVVVIFHQGLYERQCRCLERRIERARREILEDFAQQLKGKYHHREAVLLRKYHNILERMRLSDLLRVRFIGKTKRQILVLVNQRSWERRKRAFGKKIIFYDRLDYSSKEIVGFYHSKQVNEENFRFLKDRHYLHFDPIYHWTDQKIKVHALMCILGLLLVKLLLYRAREANLGMSLSVMLQELDDIEEITLLYPGDHIKKMIKKLSAVQKRLYELFKMKDYEDTS